MHGLSYNLKFSYLSNTSPGMVWMICNELELIYIIMNNSNFQVAVNERENFQIFTLT